MQATPKQQRTLRFFLRKYPDDVRPMLNERGGEIGKLASKQASEIIGYIMEKYPRDGQGGGDDGGQQEQQKQDQGDKEKNEQKLQEQKRKMGFRPGSKQEYIANALIANNMDAERTRESLSDKIGKIEALTFTFNQDGNRVPLPLGSLDDDSQAATQHGRAIKTIFAVRRSLLAGGQQQGEQKEEKQEKQEQKRDGNREATDLLAWVRQLREFCEARKADGHPVDEIGLRPVEYGALMLRAGVPITAIKHAVTMHYPPEMRRSLGVRDFDVKSFRPEQQKEGIHAALPYCLALIDAGVPIALVGPKGTGKTTLAKQIADELGRSFGMVSMTSGTSPSAFNGRPMVADDGTLALIHALSACATAATKDEDAIKHAEEALKIARDRAEKGDTVMSQFVKVYGGGGIFLFDEMDAADENLLLGVNAALANGFFANPATGEIIEQHPDFHPIAGMNTLGLGAGRDYNSRNRLDAATLDRWNAGRVQITLDPRIEEHMFWSIINNNA